MVSIGILCLLTELMITRPSLFFWDICQYLGLVLRVSSGVQILERIREAKIPYLFKIEQKGDFSYFNPLRFCGFQTSS